MFNPAVVLALLAVVATAAGEEACGILGKHPIQRCKWTCGPCYVLATICTFGNRGASTFLPNIVRSDVLFSAGLVRLDRRTNAVPG